MEYIKQGSWLKMNDKGIVERHSSREVVGEMCPPCRGDNGQEKTDKREEEIKWCRHGK